MLYVASLDVEVHSNVIMVDGSTIETDVFQTDTENLIRSSMDDETGQHTTIEVVVVATDDYESTSTG